MSGRRGARSADRSGPAVGRSRRSSALAAAVLLLAVASTVVVGCGGDDESYTTSTAAAGAATTVAMPEGEGGFGVSRDEALPPAEGDTDVVASGPVTTILGGDGLGTVEQSLDRKVISNAGILLEVSEGTFQTTFDRALQLADRYGGYVVASSASAEQGEDVLRSGTITIRIPSQSFNQAVADAGELGEVKSQSIDTQDVTEEYVDLEARLKNAQAQEKALLGLMDKAESIDEILQVQQYLAQVQMEIEQLQGRLRYLDEHTSFSTISVSIYESGVDVPDDDDWGFVAALKDALHAFVDGINAIIVGLGGALPALIVIALIAYVAYRIAAPRIRNRQARREADRSATPMAAPQPWAGQPMPPQAWAGQPATTPPVETQPPVTPAPPAASEPPAAQRSPDEESPSRG